MPSLEATALCRSQDIGRRRRLRIRDWSVEGVSVWFPDWAAQGLLAGATSALSIVDSSGQPIELEAQVRTTIVNADPALSFVGYQVRPASSSDGSRWIALLEHELHPRVRTTGECLEDVWSLYVRAGYLTLSGKNPADFFDIKASFIGATTRALQLPDVALQAVWPESGIPTATLSAVRVYETAWLGYQMAKCSGPAPDGTPSRQVLRDIHLSIYERIQRDPGARWIVGHTQVRPVWSRLCHHDFAASIVGSGDSAIWRFRAIEVPAAPKRAGASRPEGSVGLATPAETSFVLDALAHRFPQPFVEALDLVPRRFNLAGVRRRFWSAGLQRDRGLLVGRRDGQVVAALVMELSDQGLHVFRLLDHAIPIVIAAGGEALLPDLLEAARAWYFERGRDAWACFFDAGDRFTLEAGMADLGEADMCILSTDRLPEFLDHLERITAPSCE